MNADELAEALEARSNGPGRWMACCPAHDDRTPSLSIRAGDDGRPLLHCFAGCDFTDIVRELRARGLWEDKRPGRPSGPPPRKVEWARWFVRIYEADVEAQRTLSEDDLRDYRKAIGVLKEIGER